MFKKVCNSLASLMLAQTVNAASPEGLPASDLADSGNMALALLPPRPLSLSAEVKLSASVNDYQYKHAFKAHQGKRGISKLAWESESLNSHVVAVIESNTKPRSLKLEYITTAAEGQGHLTDSDYYDAQLIAQAECAGALSPETTINATVSELTFQDPKNARKVFTELTFSYTESSHYLAEDFSGFSGTKEFSDGTGAGPKVYYYYPDTRQDPPLEFDYKEFQLMPGIRSEQQLGPNTTLTLNAGLGPLYRESTDYHNWRGGGRVSTTDTLGVAGLAGGNLEIKLACVKIDLFCRLLSTWAYGELDQGASQENEASSTPVIDSSEALTSGITISGEF